MNTVPRSVNEELQSTNEELMTSKEEMQSMNEELQTLNHELQAKVDDLASASSEMRNPGTELAERLLALRPTTRVLYMSGFTSEAFDGIDLRGRPVAFIGKPFTAEALRRKIRQTLDDETPEGLPL
ncbi:MAG: response regulator [Polyangiaceae bacterium]|nr:response regulator [Polyangiaceae bacterium]